MTSGFLILLMLGFTDVSFDIMTGHVDGVIGEHVDDQRACTVFAVR